MNNQQHNNGATTMKANYWVNGKQKLLEVNGKMYVVTGKREARQLAKKLGATPWNF